MLMEPSHSLASTRLDSLPNNSFRELSILKQSLSAEGSVFIDLSEGVPDLPPPSKLLDFLSRASLRGNLHSYTSLAGSSQLRAALKEYLHKEFQVKGEHYAFMPGAGSKELIGLLCQALLNPGDVALVPELHYPLYPVAARFAGADAVFYPMQADRRYQPRLDEVPSHVLDRTRLVFLNSPHNPTGAVIEDEVLRRMIAICQERKIVLCLDLAYAHLCFCREVARGLLGSTDSVDGLIELHSFSKSLSVPGWRVAFAAGDPRIIELLEKTRSVFSTGLLVLLQKSLRYGLVHFRELNHPLREVYRVRATEAVRLLHKHGVDATEPDGGLFLWVRLPGHIANASGFVRELLLERGVLVMPGRAFGEFEDRHIRIALTRPWEELEGALEHIVAHLQQKKRL